VKVSRPNVEVRHRTEYSLRPPPPPNTPPK
jgi:hypothetical protein